MLTKDREAEIRERLNALDNLHPCTSTHLSAIGIELEHPIHCVAFDCSAAQRLAAHSPEDLRDTLAALDYERQTTAKLREALNDCEAKASLGAKMVDREHPTIADGFIIIATRAHNALKETP